MSISPPDATVQELKSIVANATTKAFNKHGFGAKRAAAVLGIAPERATALFRGQADGFTLEELRGFRERARGPIHCPADAPPKCAGGQSRPLAERFWEKVDKRGPDDCWPWTAALDDKGYGRIKWSGRMHIAPRIAYMLCVGSPEGGDVLHSCDNPVCVNPEHLRIGTHSDNMKDCYRRGRLNFQNGTGRHILEVRHSRPHVGT